MAIALPLAGGYTNTQTETHTSSVKISSWLRIQTVKPAGHDEKDLDLTDIREHLDAVLNRALLDWDQPVTVVNPEHGLQQLHKDWLPGLRRRYKTRSREAACHYIHLTRLTFTGLKGRKMSLDNVKDTHLSSTAPTIWTV